MNKSKEPKVFGIGWAKTGTTTLGRCFKALGYQHQSQRLGLVHDVEEGDLSRIRRIVERYDSFEDWPWIILFRELDTMFPGSKFILTMRDPGRWLNSYTNMLRTQGEASEELNSIRRVLYGLPFPNVTEEQLIERYCQHNREVKEYFSDRPNDLHVVNWEAGDGWDELCSFLGRETPSEPFPHANKGRYVSGIRYCARRVLEKIGFTS